MSQLQEQLDRLLDSHLLPKGVSPRFITGSHYAQAGLPEMLAYGASGGSMKQSSGGGGGDSTEGGASNVWCVSSMLLCSLDA